MKKWSGPGSKFVLDPYENEMDLKHRFNNHYFPLPVSNYITTLFCEVIRVSNRNSVAAELRASVLVLCEIPRKLHFPQLRTSKIHMRWKPSKYLSLLKGLLGNFKLPSMQTRQCSIYNERNTWFFNLIKM